MNLLFESSFTRCDVVIGLFDTSAVLAEQPTVVIASQPASFYVAIREVGPAMSALAINEAIIPLQILVQHQMFAHKPDRLHGCRIKFRERRDGHPVTPQ